MSLPPEVLEQAIRLDPGAVAQLFAAHFIRVYRIAFALSGRADTGREIARAVFRRSVDVIPKWDPSGDPEHWFHRYTIQLARQHSNQHPAIQHDLLVEHASVTDPQYTAFITALRKLPDQQQEAFLLHFGEHFTLRDSARAMDCSTHAATTHLQAAEEHLRLIAGGEFEPLAARFAHAYAHLAPDERLVVPTVSQLVRRHLWPRRVLRVIWRVILLTLLAALAYAAWWIYRHVQF